MMPVKTFLTKVEDLEPQDMVIAADSGPPLFEGMDDESLACSSCQTVVTYGVSTQTLHALFQPPGRLIYHCDCGAHAEVPAPSTVQAS
jgi:hypothetical protein